MRTESWIALAALVVTLPLAASAEPYGDRPGPRGGDPMGRGRPSFMAELYPPELLMRNQSEIGLSEEQKTAIMAAIREARDSLDPIQWQLQDEQEKLSKMLAGSAADEATLLAQAEKVMDLEKQQKKSHLVLLIKIKNELTAEQQEKAKSLRGSGRRRFGGGSGGGPGHRPRGGGPGGGRP